MASLRRTCFHSATVWILAILICAGQIALVAIILDLTLTDRLVTRPIRGITLSAASLDVASFVSTLAIVVLFLRRTALKVQMVCSCIMIALAVVAALLSIYSLVWIRNSPRQTTSSRITHTINTAGIAIWGFVALAQIAFYVIMLSARDATNSHLSSEETTVAASPVRSLKRPLSFHLAPLSTPPRDRRSSTEPGSPRLFTHSSGANSSIRTSLNHFIRPIKSKTQLLLVHSSSPRGTPSLHSGRNSPWDELRQDDGFENWDTSDVEDGRDRAFVQTTAKTRLATIPGSRPVSPARPLDGPFLNDETDHHNVPPLESTPPSIVTSPPSDTSSSRDFPSRPLSRQPSYHDVQTRIHPLFRSESPDPPPVASPGTVIVGSPLAGQVMSLQRSPSRRSERPMSEGNL